MKIPHKNMSSQTTKPDIRHVTYKILLMTSCQILKNENSISQNLVRLSAIDCIYNMQEYKTK